MPKFRVCVTTTFNKWYEIDGESAEKACESIIDGITQGDLEPTDTDDIDTTISEIKQFGK